MLQDEVAGARGAWKYNNDRKRGGAKGGGVKPIRVGVSYSPLRSWFAARIAGFTISFPFCNFFKILKCHNNNKSTKKSLFK